MPPRNPCMEDRDLTLTHLRPASPPFSSYSPLSPAQSPPRRWRPPPTCVCSAGIFGVFVHGGGAKHPFQLVGGLQRPHIHGQEGLGRRRSGANWGLRPVGAGRTRAVMCRGGGLVDAQLRQNLVDVLLLPGLLALGRLLWGRQGRGKLCGWRADGAGRRSIIIRCLFLRGSLPLCFRLVLQVYTMGTGSENAAVRALG